MFDINPLGGFGPHSTSIRTSDPTAQRVDPTPAEITERCALIRAHWSAEELLRRAGQTRRPFEIMAARRILRD